MTERPAIFESMQALADGTRGRLLAVLERRELAVSELCTVLQLPQSTVSRHLKVLSDGDWIESRREGTSRLYTFEPDRLSAAAGGLWRLARQEITAAVAAQHDARRLRSVLAERTHRSREFFSSAAGRWDQLRRELFGQHSEELALLGLLDESWTIGDLGCGTGRTAEALAPFVNRVVAVDGSPEMLEAAERRIGHFGNVEVRGGKLEALPLADGELDAALLLLVLHHIVDPSLVLREVARVLRPGGRLLVVDMLPHDREDYRREMGHLWLGFGERQLAGWTEDAGFAGLRLRTLPPDPEARGPALFAASARRKAESDELSAAETAAAVPIAVGERRLIAPKVPK